MHESAKRHPRPAILVVDDDPPILDLVGEALREEGMWAVTARTLPQALAALRAVRFDLILADPLGSFAPQFAGEQWGALDSLRDHAGATPVAIFTAHSQQQFAPYAARGFCDLIPKPFDLDQLIATIRSHLLARRPAGQHGTLTPALR